MANNERGRAGQQHQGDNRGDQSINSENNSSQEDRKRQDTGVSQSHSLPPGIAKVGNTGSARSVENNDNHGTGR